MKDPETEAIDAAAAAATDPLQLWNHFEQQESVVQEALTAARDGILELASRMAATLASEYGRVIGLGAGTSGRLLALDMAEWGPTFSVPPTRRQALIAGGDAALTTPIEGAEDDGEDARRRIRQVTPVNGDLVIGISASGSATWVRVGLEEARLAGAQTVFVTCDGAAAATRSEQDTLCILLETGAEPVAGSTRLKAATATHRLLQRASTICALHNGWIYRGRMVAMRGTNTKLRRRAVRMVMELADADEKSAVDAISLFDGDIRHSVAYLWCGDQEMAKRLLIESAGHLGPLQPNSGFSSE
ncbi:MAG: N-acetylmuramic acid 6-phosphate etherase [Planctomycetota bacterium]|nr:N-acetylmuramic acid 6-phosphate etherase [Planctomycetota bacterium]